MYIWAAIFFIVRFVEIRLIRLVFFHFIHHRLTHVLVLLLIVFTKQGIPLFSCLLFQLAKFPFLLHTFFVRIPTACNERRGRM